jgi:hypothetical protein
MPLTRLYILGRMVRGSRRALVAVLVILSVLTSNYLLGYESVLITGASSSDDADTALRADAYVRRGWELGASQYSPKLEYSLRRQRWVGWVEVLRDAF